MSRIGEKRQRVIGIWIEENFNYKSGPHRRSGWEDIWIKLDEANVSPGGEVKSGWQHAWKADERGMSVAEWDKGKIVEDGVGVGTAKEWVWLKGKEITRKSQSGEWIQSVLGGVGECIIWMGMQVIYKA